MVLFRENPSRRHDRSLMAVSRSQEHGVDRDRRLSRPDVALKQPIGRDLTGQIIANLAADLPLIRGEFERKATENSPLDFGGQGQGRRFHCLAKVLTLHHHPELQQ
jgi:hypothetical protein